MNDFSLNRSRLESYSVQELHLLLCSALMLVCIETSAVSLNVRFCVGRVHAHAKTKCTSETSWLIHLPSALFEDYFATNAKVIKCTRQRSDSAARSKNTEHRIEIPMRTNQHIPESMNGVGNAITQDEIIVSDRFWHVSLALRAGMGHDDDDDNRLTLCFGRQERREKTMSFVAFFFFVLRVWLIRPCTTPLINRSGSQWLSATIEYNAMCNLNSRAQHLPLPLLLRSNLTFHSVTNHLGGPTRTKRRRHKTCATVSTARRAITINK